MAAYNNTRPSAVEVDFVHFPSQVRVVPFYDGSVTDLSGLAAAEFKNARVATDEIHLRVLVRRGAEFADSLTIVPNPFK